MQINITLIVNCFWLVSDADPFRDLVSILDDNVDPESDLDSDFETNMDLDEDFVKPAIPTTTDQPSTQQPLCPGKRIDPF